VDTQPTMSACEVCKKPAKSFCGACMSAAYCSRACLVIGWKDIHQIQCGFLPKGLKGLKFRPLSKKGPSQSPPTGSPLCTLADEVSHSGDDVVESYYRHSPPGGDLGQYLRKISSNNLVYLDDALFVQVVLAARGHLSNRPLIFGVGGWAPWVLLDGQLKNTDLGECRPGYYAPKSGSACKIVNKALGTGGKWLLGPDKLGRYLGLGDDGPVRLPLRSWHIMLVRGLVREKKNNTRKDDGLQILMVDGLKESDCEVHRVNPTPH
jgi:hypothetical protein